MTPTGTRLAAEPATGELAEHLRLAIGRLARLLRRHDDGGLTPSQLSALSSIVALQADDGIRLGELAAHEGVGAPGMTRIVGALVVAGLLERRPDPLDGRSVLLRSSAAGARLLAQGRAARTAYLAARVDGLTAGERDALVAVLPVLERLAAAPEEPAH